LRGKEKLKALFKKYLYKLIENLSVFIPFKNSFKFSVKDKIVILVLKPLGIGDTIMISPLFSLLNKKFPEREIYFSTDYEEFLELEKVKWIPPETLTKEFLADALLIVPSLALTQSKYAFRSKYVLGYFFSNRLVCNFRKKEFSYSFAGGHFFERIIPILEILNIEFDLNNLSYPKLKCEKLYCDLADVVIAPYSNWKTKQYPLMKYLQLIKDLMKDNKKIMLIGSKNLDEVNFNRNLENLVSSKKIINLTGKTNLREMNYIVQNTPLFIGNDSGPAHCSFISKNSSLVFFGATDFNTLVPRNDSLINKIICMDNRDSCRFFPCYNGFTEPHCKKRNSKYSCISGIKIN